MLDEDRYARITVEQILKLAKAVHKFHPSETVELICDDQSTVLGAILDPTGYGTEYECNEEALKAESYREL